MRLFKQLCLLMAFVVLSSCMKEDYDFNNINIEEYNPAVAAPLVNTKFKLHDLLDDYLASDSALLEIDNDSLLWIRYSADLFSMSVSDFFSIPAQSINEAYGMQPFAMDPFSSSAAIELGDVVGNFSDPEKTLIQSNDGGTAPFPALPSQSGGEHSIAPLTGFTTVTFAGGSMDITIQNNWPIPVSMTIELRNVGDNSLIGTTVFPSIAPNTNETESIDLTNQTMSNSIKFAITSISSPGSLGLPVPIDLTDDLDITVASNNLSVSGGTAVFPSQSIIDQNFDVDMDQGNGEQLNILRLKDGSLDLNITYGINENALMTLSLPYATKSGIPFNQTINLTGGNNSSESFDLSGYEFDLTAGGTKTNAIVANIKASLISSGVPVPFSLTDSVKAAITLGSLEIAYLEGDVGTQNFSAPADTVDFSFNEVDIDADITLADPRLSLIIRNSFGLELGADLSGIYAANDNQTLQLTGLANPTVINAPTLAEVGSIDTTTITISNATTNIGDILNIQPTKFIFGVSGSTNPSGGVSSNFILDTSKVEIAMGLDVPLYGGISGFALRDTFEFPTEAFENVKTASLRTYIKNEFPIGVGLQMYFVDENYTVLDSIGDSPIAILESSTVSSTGDLVAPSESTKDIGLTEAQVVNLKDAKKIIMVSSLATANDGATNAKFYSSHELEIKLGIFAKVKVKLKED